MFEAIGCRVIYLKRLSMGSLTLDPALEKGSVPQTDQEEEHCGTFTAAKKGKE